MFFALDAFDLPLAVWEKNHTRRVFCAKSTPGQLEISVGSFQRFYKIPGTCHHILSEVIRFFAIKAGERKYTDRIVDVFRTKIDGVSVSEHICLLENSVPRAVLLQTEIQVTSVLESFLKKVGTVSVDLEPVAKEIVNLVRENFPAYSPKDTTSFAICSSPQEPVPVAEAPLEPPVVPAPTVVSTPIVAPAVLETPTAPPAPAPVQSPSYPPVEARYPEGFLRDVPYASAKEKNDRHSKAVKFFHKPQEMAKAMDVIEGLLTKELVTQKIIDGVMPATLAEIYIQMPTSLEVGLAPYAYAVKVAQQMLQRGMIPHPTSLALQAFVRTADWERFLRLKNDPNASYQQFFAELLKESMGTTLTVNDVATTVTHLNGKI